jgi:hypothetical protein
MYVNLLGREGIVGSVSLDQSYRGAMYQFERAYFAYHVGRGRRGRYARLRRVGVEISAIYRRCHKLGVQVR